MKTTEHKHGYVPEHKTLTATELAERDYDYLSPEAGRYQAAQDLAAERNVRNREHRDLVRIDRQIKLGEIAAGIRDYEEHRNAAEAGRREVISVSVDSDDARELQIPVRQQ